MRNYASSFKKALFGILERSPNLYKIYDIYKFYKNTLTPSLPRNAWIDPVNTCILKCPICPTGSGRLKQKQTMMSAAKFEMIIEQIPTLKTVELYNWGEPFLNKELPSMIRFAKSKGITVGIHSNLNLDLEDKFVKAIIFSGLDSLSISLDGANQKSYEAYRRHGDFAKVIENIKFFERKKRKLESLTPRLVWKFIVNRFNEKEIQRAKQNANEIGIEFSIQKFSIGDLAPDMPMLAPVETLRREWLPEDERFLNERYIGRYARPAFNRLCPYLFSYVVITPSGSVLPCCLVTDEKNAFGNIFEEPFEVIWHNDRYRFSRSLFNRRKYVGPPVETVCSHCSNYRKAQTS